MTVGKHFEHHICAKAHHYHTNFYLTIQIKMHTKKPLHRITNLIASFEG